MKIPLVLSTALALIIILAGCLGSDAGPSVGPNGPVQEGTNGSLIDDHPGASAHVHDRWDNRSEAVVFEDTVHIEKDNELNPEKGLESYLICELRCDYFAEFIPPEGQVVPPGTDHLEVRVDWASDTQVILAYQAANENSFTEMDRQSSTAQWTINTTVEMADEGHARLSLWRFRLYSCQDCLVVGPSSFEFEVDVMIVAHRAPGPLPIEPPHPDWWADGAARPVYAETGEVSRAGTGPHYVRTDGTPGFAVGGSWVRDVGREDHGYVPPGTRLLGVFFNWSGDAPAGEELRPVPWFEWNNKLHEWNRVEATSASSGQVVYAVPITANMVDGMYANKSRWQFRFGFTGEDTGQTDPFFGGPMTEPYVVGGDWQVSIVAYRVDDPGAVTRESS